MEECFNSYAGESFGGVEGKGSLGIAEGEREIFQALKRSFE